MLPLFMYPVLLQLSHRDVRTFWCPSCVALRYFSGSIHKHKQYDVITSHLTAPMKPQICRIRSGLPFRVLQDAHDGGRERESGRSSWAVGKQCVSVLRAGGHGHGGHTEWTQWVQISVYLCSWLRLTGGRGGITPHVLRYVELGSCDVSASAVCCGRWVGGSCVSMVRTVSVFRILDCAYNEDCKSAKCHRFAARFVQQTASQYLPYQPHNNKPAAYKQLTLLLHVSTYIGRHLTSHVCTRTLTEQQQQHGYRRHRKYHNACNVTSYI